MTNSIFCSPTHFKLVAGEADGKTITVKKFAEAPLPGNGMINGIITDTDVMTTFFAQAAEAYDLRKNPTYVVLDTNNIQAKTMEVPPVSEAKILEFIRHELADQSGASELVTDYAVLDPKASSGGVSVLAVAVNRETLESYRTALVGAGIDIRGINIATNCLIKIARLLPALADQTFLLVQSEGRFSQVALFSGGKYIVGNKNRLLHDPGTAEWMGEIGAGISSMIQFNKGAHGPDIQAAYIEGVNPALMPVLGDSLSYLDIGIRTLDFSGVVVSEDPAFYPGSFLLNLGNLLKK
jgi:hypothetical protein